MENSELLRILRLIGTNLYIGVTVIDKNGVVVFRNKGMEEISGISSADTIDKKFSEISKDHSLLKVLRKGEPQLGVLYSTANGKQAVIHRIPLKEDSLVFGAMSIAAFYDVTELQDILRKYNLLKEKMEYLKNELRDLRGAKYTFNNITGKSNLMLELRKEARRYANKNFNILITGESGTGKEIFAHAIHDESNRKNGPFVRLNCSCFPRELLESELFGYEEGSFTGAKRKGKPGKFELAHKGTIFLDEIGDLPFEIQPKFLRVLEEQEIWRLGSLKPQRIDFRLIASANQNLKEMVEEERFREDLYYRLSVLTLHIPPLRDRRVDIPLLTQHILKNLNSELGTNFKLDKQTLFLLQNNTYKWPGNVRELRNVLERAVAVAEQEVIEPRHLPPYLPLVPAKEQLREDWLLDAKGILREALLKKEEEILSEVIHRVGGNKARAARLLGVSRTCLYDKLNKYKI